jgi:hypothetical protein
MVSFLGEVVEAILHGARRGALICVIRTSAAFPGVPGDHEKALVPAPDSEPKGPSLGHLFSGTAPRAFGMPRLTTGRGKSRGDFPRAPGAWLPRAWHALPAHWDLVDGVRQGGSSGTGPFANGRSAGGRTDGKQRCLAGRRDQYHQARRLSLITELRALQLTGPLSFSSA